jgi:hypothetical protein
MKKLFAVALAAALALPSVAAEPAAPAAPKAASADSPKVSALWPACFAFCEWPATPDLIGLRLSIPYSTRQECVTGLDLGLWGRCKDFEGLQVNVLRNDAKDTLAGFQIGLYNTAQRADLLCFQIGLVNETQGFRGLQAGLVNMTGDGQGFQIGLINRAESFYGFQIGAINVIREADVPFLPVVNIGF